MTGLTLRFHRSEQSPKPVTERSKKTSGCSETDRRIDLLASQTIAPELESRNLRPLASFFVAEVVKTFDDPTPIGKFTD
ncbi:hypothetical protein K227x_45330 [Rubripirellula lacrimiformis]|uniref:Uncharacterized protein n=1 Tax=Rubripirellula lacrimiformis TaxID=1930273 RepID=A0A517NG74_9BACT|nr:hypothetical protein K227x_45330 [Rubripirellula lacrimiformis]